MLQDEADRIPVSFWRVALYFLRLGAIGFGGPIALVGRMQQDLVNERRWVTRKEYLEGLALSQLAAGPLAEQLAMYLGYIRGGIPGASVVAILFILPSFLLVWVISPGPVVITSAFIGYIVAGFPGMVAAAIGVFLPVYLFVIVAAPYFHRYGQQPQVRAFVDGVTAAAAGAIAGAAFVLARRAFVDPMTVAIGVATFVILFRFKVSELWLSVAAAAGLGWWMRG